MKENSRSQREKEQRITQLKCHVTFEKEISNWDLMGREKDLGRGNSRYMASERERSREYQWDYKQTCLLRAESGRGVA